jgi:hypothetical protein
MSTLIVDTVRTDTLQDEAGAFEHARLVQVQSASKADSFTTSSTSFVDVTGLTIAITPTVAANKILVLVSTQLSQSAGSNLVAIQLVRAISGGATSNIALSTGASSHNMSNFAIPSGSFNSVGVSTIVLDSPSTTSATTYHVEMKAGANTAAIGRRGDDTTSGAFSSITVMEIRT